MRNSKDILFTKIIELQYGKSSLDIIGRRDSIDHPVIDNKTQVEYVKVSEIEETKLTRETENTFKSFLDMSETNPAAMNNLGVLYYKGIGVERNFEKGMECFEKAAAKGHKVAEFNRGFCYERGEGVAKDLKKAFECFNRAQSLQFYLPRIHLSLYYRLGLGGIPRDPGKALELEKANEGLRPLFSQSTESMNLAKFWFEEEGNTGNIVSVHSTNKKNQIRSYALIDWRYTYVFNYNKKNPIFADQPPIYKAAFEGDLKAFEECIRELGSDQIKNLQLENGITPLIMAVLGNSREVIKRLYELGCDPNKGWYEAPWSDKISTVHLAALSGNNLTLKAILSKKIDLNTIAMNDNESPLSCAAISRDNGECVELLLEAGLDINEKLGEQGITLLWRAVFDRNYTLLRFLCDKGAKDLLVKRADEGRDFESALSYACEHGDVRSVEILTDYEHCSFPLSFPYLKYKDSWTTPLGIAIANDNVEVVKTILKSKAKWKEALRPKQGKDCLTMAIEARSFEIIELLFKEKMFDINEQDEQGRTFLHKLILTGALPCDEESHVLQRLLLDYKFNYKLEDKKGLTPLMLCLMVREEVEGLMVREEVEASMIERLERVTISDFYREKGNDLADKIFKNKIWGALVFGNTIAAWILFATLLERSADIFKNKGVEKTDFNSRQLTEQIFRLTDKLTSFLISIKTREGHILQIPTTEFEESVIPRNIKRMLPQHIKITDSLLLQITEILFEKTLQAKKLVSLVQGQQGSVQGQLGLVQGQQGLVQGYQLQRINYKDIKNIPPLSNHELFQLIWDCSEEKLIFKKKCSDKKLQAELKEIDSDLLLLPSKVAKYMDEQLKLAKKRLAVNEILSNIRVLSNGMSDGALGASKLQAAERMVAEISGISEKLLQQQVSFASAHKKLQPKIKNCLAQSDAKQAKKLLGHLHKIQTRIETLGAAFKDLFNDITKIEEFLTEQLSFDKARRLLLQKREEEKLGKEKAYLQLCIEKLKNAEQRFKELQSAVHERVQVEKEQQVEFQSRLSKQKQQKTEVYIAAKEMKQAKEQEADKMLTLAANNEHYKPKRPRNIQLNRYFVQPQLKLKASEELAKLAELLQDITFEENNIFNFGREQGGLTPEIFAKMQRAAIMGIVARAMECHKQIRVNNKGALNSGIKDNIFKEYARIFRNAAFHCLDEKLFKKIGDDPKKNAEANQPFIDMACKMLAFLNDAKWQKQAISKEDILQAFAGKSPESDLFTKIIKLSIKTPSAQECKTQILQGYRELREFVALKDQVPDIFYQAAVGFCYARIGCFAAELIKPKKSLQETRECRAVFNELRHEYKIPLGKYIQMGNAFRHITVSAKPIQEAAPEPELVPGQTLETSVAVTGSVLQAEDELALQLKLRERGSKGRV